MRPSRIDSLLRLVDRAAYRCLGLEYPPGENTMTDEKKIYKELANVHLDLANLSAKAHHGTATAGELSILNDPNTPLMDYITGRKIDYKKLEAAHTDRYFYYSRKARGTEPPASE
jgi:hypothetical protein